MNAVQRCQDNVASVIHKRTGHVGVVYDNLIIIWGGYMERNDSTVINEYHFTSEIWVFNVMEETWTRVNTRGECPPVSSGSCGIIYKDSLYIYGGYQSPEGSEPGTSDKLYCLDLKTMTWRLCLPGGTPPLPCDKTVGWVYDHKLYFFGGFGPQRNDSRQEMVPPKYQLIIDSSINYLLWKRGWNNQLVCYDIKSNTWEWPSTKGQKPSPRAAHSADIIDGKIYIFGGRLLANRMNDLHMLDMKTMTWSGNLSKSGNPVPDGRSWHTFNFVSDHLAILYGGFDDNNKVLSDVWLFNTNTMNWEYFVDAGETRLWHTSCFIPTAGELVVIGGVKNNISDHNIEKDHPKDCLFIRLTPKSLFRLCLDVTLKLHGMLNKLFEDLPNDIHNVLRKRRSQKNGGA